MKIIKTILTCLLFVGMFQTSNAQTPGSPYLVPTKISISTTNLTGTGTLTGKKCFDIALGNNNINDCGPLTARTTMQDNFNLSSTNVQTYTFTPSGTVSNVRFTFVNTNGSVISSISGGNSGNNISTAVNATVNYNTNLNTLAAGLTDSNPLKADVYVVYNNTSNNTGTDRQLKLTANVKDCTCNCFAVVNGSYLGFDCYNLGANRSLDPFTYDAGLLGDYYQWGRQTDGHEVSNSSVANGPVAAPVAGQFIRTSANSNWLTPTDLSLWLDNSKTANDPCPAGYRVPTQAQWAGLYGGNLGSPSAATQNTWTWTGNGFKVGAFLYLPATGFRRGSDGALFSQGVRAYYWSSSNSPTGDGSRYLDFKIDLVNTGTTTAIRSNGGSVRCVVE